VISRIIKVDVSAITVSVEPRVRLMTLTDTLIIRDNSAFCTKSIHKNVVRSCGFFLFLIVYLELPLAIKIHTAGSTYT
jgi:hypothetical protein